MTEEELDNEVFLDDFDDDDDLEDTSLSEVSASEDLEDDGSDE